MGKRGKESGPSSSVADLHSSLLTLPVFYSRWTITCLFSLCLPSLAIELDRPTERLTWRTVEQQRITRIVHGGVIERNMLMRNPDHWRVAFANPFQCTIGFIQDVKAYMSINCTVHCRPRLLFCILKPLFLLDYYRLWLIFDRFSFHVWFPFSSSRFWVQIDGVQWPLFCSLSRSPLIFIL